MYSPFRESFKKLHGQMKKRMKPKGFFLWGKGGAFKRNLNSAHRLRIDARCFIVLMLLR